MSLTVYRMQALMLLSLTCLGFDCSLDDGFPAVTFHFADSLNLTAYPHDYLFIVTVSISSFVSLIK